MMVRWAGDGAGRTAVAHERAFEIAILDVLRHIASVKVLSHPYMDHLHVAKFGDRWLIANVFYEVREGAQTHPWRLGRQSTISNGWIRESGPPGLGAGSSGSGPPSAPLAAKAASSWARRVGIPDSRAAA